VLLLEEFLCGIVKADLLSFVAGHIIRQGAGKLYVNAN
jgi:hypothetical protein